MLPVRGFSEIEPVRARLLVRAIAIVIVAAAVILAGLALRDPTPVPAPGVVRPIRSDPQTVQLRACSAMGEQALKSAECRSAWAAHRERFLQDRTLPVGAAIADHAATSATEGQ